MRRCRARPGRPAGGGAAAHTGASGRARARPGRRLRRPARRRGAARARSAARAETSSALSASPSRASAVAAAASRAISANGRSSRRLRARNAAPRPRRRLRAGQVIAADALDRQHRPPASRLRGGVHGVGTAGRARRGSPSRSEQLRARPACGAGVRLRVKAPVAGIVVLGLALRAHRESGHRRRRPVVGHAADDREARPAVRAVDERVAEAAVGRVAQLGEAVVAGRRVRRHQCVGVTLADALDDAELALAGRRERVAVDALDDGQRRRLAGEPGEEADGAPRPPPRARRRARR